MSNVISGEVPAYGSLAGHVSAILAKDGQSAYEIAVANGFKGTETEWLQSLKGDTGEKGDTGAQGIRGEKGDTGDKGEPGETPERGVDYWTEEDKREIVDEVLDEGLLRYDKQALTDEQKAQAQENLGLTIDDSKTGSNLWTSMNIVDRLCPPFEESGSVVYCNPVEGYPLEVVSAIEPIQDGEGDPSPDNIRPISGWTGAKLRRAGRNLFGGDAFADILVEQHNQSKDENAGTVSIIPGLSNDRSVPLFDAFKEQTQYTFILRGKNRFAAYPAVTNLVVRYTNSALGYPSFENGICVYTTTPGLSVKSLCVSNSAGIAEFYYNQCGVFEGVITEADFEPSGDTDFTVDFGQTVYGGSFDWQTGVLTVTHGNIESYAGEPVPDGWISSTGELSEGAQVVYPLEEPTTVQLVSQNVTAMSGENTLYSDTGNTTVSGKADPASVFEKLTNAIIAMGGNV